MRLPFVVVASVLFCTAACGSSVTHQLDGGSGGSSAAGPCPATEPAGGNCAEEGLRCSFGSSPRPECRHVWTCTNESWVPTKLTCPEPPAGTCEQLPPSADGTVCAQENASCVEGAATVCVCTSCATGPCMLPPPKWTCVAPPSTPGCPGLVPNEGTVCSTEGLECDYGPHCSVSGAVRTCKGGLWVGHGIVCPV